MQPNPLLIRLPNWIGDALMALPAINALNQAGFEITLTGKAWAPSLFSLTPYPTLIYPTKIKNQISFLKNQPQENILLLPNSLSSAIAPFFSAKNALGYAKNWRSPLLKYAFELPQFCHEVEYFWRLAKKAAKKLNSDCTWPLTIPRKPLLILSDSIKEKANAKLMEYHIQKPFYCLCPGATGKGKEGQTKRWPHWKELDEALNQKGIITIACPGPGEENHFKTQCPHAILIKNISLDLYAAIMKTADKVITNDSGPMHLASFVDANFIGIFGVTNAHKTGPWIGAYIQGKNGWPSIDEVIFKTTSVCLKT